MKTKNEIEEEKQKEMQHQNTVSSLTNKIQELQERVNDYRGKLAIQKENSDKLGKLYDLGYIDEDGNPLK